ncbi:hypothetical protein CIF90_07810 [Neisseria gonorrhoeae]
MNFNWYLEIFEIGQAAIKRSNTTADKSLCVGNSGKTMKITLKILMGLAYKDAPKTEIAYPETFTKPINFKIIKITN